MLKQRKETKWLKKVYGMINLLNFPTIYQNIEFHMHRFYEALVEADRLRSTKNQKKKGKPGSSEKS